MNSLSDLQAAIRAALAANKYPGPAAYRNAKSGGGQFSDAQIATAEAEAQAALDTARAKVVAEQQQRTEAQGAAFNRELQATLQRGGFTVEAQVPPVDKMMSDRLRAAMSERNNPKNEG